MYLRLSNQFNTALFPRDCGVGLVDITPTSPTYGIPLALSCGAISASTRYICGPLMWIRPTPGSPLRPGTTYALLVRKTISDLSGNPFGPDDDFNFMLASCMARATVGRPKR